MKDKNGVEIKEGDIVEFSHPLASEILRQGEIKKIETSTIIIVFGRMGDEIVRRTPSSVRVIENA